MRFSEIYAGSLPSISFELFPPNTDKGIKELEERLPKLISLSPSIITVTYGAMGNTREKTLEIASMIKNQYGIDTAHHLTCVGSSNSEIEKILNDIHDNGIENIVALRGDPPKGQTSFVKPENGYGHANELVSHIVDHGGFDVAVAGYPEKHIEAVDLQSDLTNLKTKVLNGADLIITQLYYDNDDFYRFVDSCRSFGINAPIVPGLMPILNTDQIKRITSMCGATIPVQLLKKLEDASSDQSRVHEIGIEHTANQAIDLLQHGVPGIHFYVLNRYFHIAEIMDRIKPTLTMNK